MAEQERGAAADADGAQGPDKRTFYRVKARLPIRVRALDPGEAEALSLEISSPSEEPLPNVDPGLLAILQRIENKVDLVLSRLDEHRPQPLGIADLRTVDLSGAGVSFEADADDLGDQVLVELQIPGPPPRQVRAIAHPVLWNEGDARPSGGKRGLAAFAFDVISERDRDAIVHFSHDVQRRELRERASARRER